MRNNFRLLTNKINRDNTKYKTTIGAAALYLILALAAFGQAQTSPVNLELNKPLERQIKGGETQTFQFNVKAGFYARAEVEQKNIDVVVSLFAPDGKLVVEMDGKDGRLWREAVSVISEKKGKYRIEIKAYGAAYQSRSYMVKLAENRKFAPNDSKRLEAESHLSAGRKFHSQNEPKFLEAAKEYETAISLWRELGEAEWEAIALTYLGWANSNLSKNEQAIDAHTRAVKLFQKTEDRLGESKAVNGLGNVYNDLGQYDKALEFYEKALSIRKEIGDRQGESKTLFNLAKVYESLKQYGKALEFYEKALSIKKEIGDRQGESETLINLGNVYKSLNQSERARKYFEQALIIKRELKDTLGEVNALTDLAGTFRRDTQSEKRLEYLEEALNSVRKLEDNEKKTELLYFICSSYSIFNGEKSRQCYEKALTLSQKTKDRKWEMSILRRLSTNQVRTKPEQAILYQEQILTISREIKDKSEELSALWFLGSIYKLQGKYEKALKYYEEGILLSREAKDRSKEGDALQSIGFLYSELKNYEKAQKYFEQFVAIQEELKLDFSEVDVYTIIYLGENYSKLKQYEKALQIYEKALFLIKDEDMKPDILLALANLFKEQKQYDKAQKYLEQQLALGRKEKYDYIESWALTELGKLFLETKQYDKARSYYEQSLSIDLKSKTLDADFFSLQLLGELYLELKQYEKARDYLERVFADLQKHSTSPNDGKMYSMMTTLYVGLNKTQLAIFYGKKAVNAYQIIRSEIKTFDRDTQRNFVKDKEPAYRKLADLLISKGRLIEAQAVLDLLKVEEFKNVVLRRSGETPDTVPYSKAEANVGKQVENLAKLERERAVLLKLKEQAALPADKQARFDQIPTEIEAANRAFRLALDALGKTESSSTDRVAEIQSEKSLQRALGQLSKETNSGAVAIYTVLGTEEKDNKSKTKFGWIILVTPTSRKAYPIDVADLEQTVFQFRDALISDKYDPKPAAQKLYQKLFRQTSAKQKTTLEDDLETLLSGYKDKTLMWSLDGILRYVPMAALHDGAGYLVEKYRSVIFTKESFLTLLEKDAAKWQVLGLGVSERRENFNALPGAERELKDIVRLPQTKTGILDGTIKLNKDFSEEATLKLWREGAFPVIHIASHYSFNSTDPTSSFLLVGDGHLSFSEMQDKDNLFGAVDLLTLSACDTGLSGNGKEAEGFAYLAQSLGAKSVIASLWQVSDTGTPEMMTRFYELRKTNPKMPKGEAFRQAQLAMLGAETKKEATKINDAKKNQKTSRSELIDLSGQSIELSLFKKDPQNPFAHPHYWSSFVLIGNWR